MAELAIYDQAAAARRRSGMLPPPARTGRATRWGHSGGHRCGRWCRAAGEQRPGVRERCGVVIGVADEHDVVWCGPLGDLMDGLPGTASRCRCRGNRRCPPRRPDPGLVPVPQPPPASHPGPEAQLLWQELSRDPRVQHEQDADRTGGAPSQLLALGSVRSRRESASRLASSASIAAICMRITTPIGENGGASPRLIARSRLRAWSSAVAHRTTSGSRITDP